jgi:hypothetical protein
MLARRGALAPVVIACALVVGCRTQSVAPVALAGAASAVVPSVQDARSIKTFTISFATFIPADHRRSGPPRPASRVRAAENDPAGRAAQRPDRLLLLNRLGHRHHQRHLRPGANVRSRRHMGRLPGGRALHQPPARAVDDTRRLAGLAVGSSQALAGNRRLPFRQKRAARECGNGNRGLS